MINTAALSNGAWYRRRSSDIETQLPEVVLRVELIVGGMSIDIENGENRQKSYHPKVRFLPMKCLILRDLRVVERGL